MAKSVIALRSIPKEYVGYYVLLTKVVHLDDKPLRVPSLNEPSKVWLRWLRSRLGFTMWSRSRGVTQLMLGQALGVSRGAVYMWSCGERNPGEAVLKAIAKYVHEKK